MTFRPLDPHGGRDMRRERRDLALRATLRRCAVQHPHYRTRLGDDRLRATADAGLEGFTGFPLTRKDDFLADPTAFVLEPSAGDPDEYLEWDHAYTGGTSTGVRARITQTAWDFPAILYVQQRMAEIRVWVGPTGS